MSRRQLIDNFINKYISRKLIVFIVACYGLFSGVITSSDWITIAGVYIATQGAIDAITRLRK